MAVTSIPLGGAGIAAFQKGAEFTVGEVFNATIPIPTTEDFAVPANTSWPAYAVVGLLAGVLALATNGDAPGTSATGTLTFSAAGTAGDTITVGARVYTLAAAAGAANTVRIGATAAETAANFLAAINGGAGAGQAYGNGTVPHADVSARAGSGAGVVGLYAKDAGTAGNAIATTESGTATAFGAGTLAGGQNAAGVDALGVTVSPVDTGASADTRVAVYLSGNFNPAALHWHESFVDMSDKKAAFKGSPTPTNIIVRERL